uniref:gamma-secretase subunit Aph-1b-like isoform X2 n=1 Tax=Myxine glutinosa TaxID=7769 RepID=UPI00358FD808
MTLSVFVGCSFITFGPAISLFVLTIASDPLRIIILVAGSFFWLLSLLLSSLVWFIAEKVNESLGQNFQHQLLVFGVVISVLLQEIFRFAFFRILQKAEHGLTVFSNDGQPPITVRQMAYVAGLGFGVVSAAFSMLNLLAQASGPGAVGIHGDSQYFFITSAFMSLALVFLHTCWGVVFFGACEHRRWFSIFIVVVSHLLISVLSLVGPLHKVCLPVAYASLLLLVVWAFNVAGVSLRGLQRFLPCKERQYLLFGCQTTEQLPLLQPSLEEE